ncbi:LuxR C-terminal-related transcriptional regulator [Flavobacterium sp.]|uniref:helix-turn-helix transcriptional regulator n=1 Tax=Flavobacterium sp. TaxID=239 RepID=UPI002629F493|nr:LuxR C-terminal-related transcriptional regulator [Flavobacterium sp.]MDD3003449.1 LuxR C-terminal-related transcriptional regulator [Flavobacterium sp.]
MDFQHNFEIAFPELIDSFKSYAAEMTVSEIRHLMLAKLGFNNKEMARTLGVSESAIRVTWSRIRKKLNLSQEETAISLINRILENKEVISN